MTERTIRKFGEILGLDAGELQEHVLREGRRGPLAANDQSVQVLRELTEDTVAVISGFEHYAILELTHLDEFRPDVSWVARVLGLDPDAVNVAIYRLLRLGLLEMVSPTEWIDCTGDVTNLLDGRSVPLYGDGLNVRDWIHVIDHCEALLRVLEQGRPGEVYNIGGDNERSNLELTRAIVKLMGLGEEVVEHVPDRPGHDRRYAIDATRMREELGWQPTRSLWPDAVAATIQWYRDHEPWWRPLKADAFNATMLSSR